MHVTVITAFPELFRDFLGTSIVGRAVKKGLIRVDILNLRDFGRGGYRQIDDYAFGSGGMVLAAPQLKDALDKARGDENKNKAFVVYPSPQGVLLTQEIIETLARQEQVIILCGHYEGIDERFIEREADLEFSTGDCVLTGGELPAMTVIDAMSRLVPGTVGRSEAVADDSFYQGMLDHPHYTRPALWEDAAVPEVLLSGNEAEVRAWRRDKAIERTLSRRPDLLAQASIRDYLSGGAYLAASFMDGPEEGFIPDLSPLCRVYDLGRPFLIIPDAERRRAFVRDRQERQDSPRVLGSLRRVRDWIVSRESRENGENLLTVKILASPAMGTMHVSEVKRRCLEHKGPVLFLFPSSPAESEKNGKNGDEIEEDVLTTSLFREKEELPLLLRAAVALDRFLGKR